jgi:FtsH-binding integral membrane protein
VRNSFPSVLTERPWLSIYSIMACQLLFTGMFASLALGAGIIRDAAEVLESYDYVIAGGGLSGLVVANRLSEDPDGKAVDGLEMHHSRL